MCSGQEVLLVNIRKVTVMDTFYRGHYSSVRKQCNFPLIISLDHLGFLLTYIVGSYVCEGKEG